MKTFLVAEIGLNHMGSQDYADEYLKKLSGSGFKAITFQVREPAFYAGGEVEKSLQLPDQYYARAARRVREAGLRFGVALCDAEKIPVFEAMGTNFYKVLSKDALDVGLVRKLLATGKPVWVSTGMSDEEDIQKLLGNVEKQNNLFLIHTELSYEDASTNLRAIAFLRERFVVPVGFGLHSTEASALYAAIAFEPAALFAYVKGTRVSRHRDEDHALLLGECPPVAQRIKRLEAMLGSGVKSKMGNRIPDQQ